MRKILIIFMVLAVGIMGLCEEKILLPEHTSFQEQPIEDILSKIFSLANNTPYVIESNLSVIKASLVVQWWERDLESCLKNVLDYKDLTFTKDDIGVYHIKKRWDPDQILQDNNIYTKSYPLTNFNTSDAELIGGIRRVLSKQGV